MMENKEIVKEWIEKAEEDFRFTSSSLELNNYFAKSAFIFSEQLKSISKPLLFQ